MDYHTAERTPGAGFTFEVPVPLPELGHRFAQPFAVEGHGAVLMVVQVPRDEPVSGLRVEGPGLRDHSRDRFGVFSRSRVEIRLRMTQRDLIALGLMGPVVVFKTPSGENAGLVGPTEEGRDFCARVVNDLIDAYSRVHATYWLPTVTPDDIVSLNLVDWGSPGQPAIIGMAFGTGTAHTFRFGRADGYPATAPDRIVAALSRPPSLAEDLLLAARRDLATRRHRSALAHACLAFEVFVRSLLEANADRVPDPGFRDKTLKPMCERKGCLPALIGGKSLNNDVHGARRDDYEKVAALRDGLLHQGRTSYKLRDGVVEVVGDPAVEDHVNMVVRLAQYLSEVVKENGGTAVEFG